MLAGVLALAAGSALVLSPRASATALGTMTADVNGGGAQEGLNTQSATGSSTGNVIAFTYTSTSETTTTEFDVLVPTGWTAPQTSSSGDPGYVSVSDCTGFGSLQINGGAGGRDVQVNGTFEQPNPACTLNYTGTAPSANSTQTWASQANTAALNSPQITVLPPDGSGTMDVTPTHVLHSSSGNTLTFTYTPVATMNGGAVSLVVPADWPAPSTIPTEPGYTTVGCESCSHAGDIGISGQTITISNIDTNQAILIFYGDQGSGGPGATAPSTAGSEQWDASSQSAGGSGSLQPLSASPSVDVISPAADGSGTLGVAPTSVIGHSSGNDLTFTYTAASGGLFDGKLTIAEPAGGWTAFSAGSTQVTGCAGCSVSYPSGNLELDNVTLDGGDEVTIDLTTDAPAVQDDYSFAAQEAGTSGGTLTDLAASPSVTVGAGAPDHLHFTSSTAALQSGDHRAINVAVEDALDNVVTDSNGETIHITQSGTGDVSFGGSTDASPTTSDGVATVTATAQASGSVSLAASGTSGSINGIDDNGTSDFSVYPARYALSGDPSQQAGAFNDVQVVAQDAVYGGGFTTATNYTGDHTLTFSGASNAPDGTTPAVNDKDGTPINFGSGTTLSFTSGVTSVSNPGHSNGGLQLVKAEDASVSATGDSATISTASPLDVTVAPLGIDHFSVSGTATQTAGDSQIVAFTARDQYGNVATSYDGFKSIEVTGALNAPSGAGPYFTGNPGQGSVQVPFGTCSNPGDADQTNFSTGTGYTNMTLYTAETAHIRVQSCDSDATTPDGDRLQVDVGPAAASRFLMTSTPPDVAAGNTFSVTTSSADQYGNISPVSADESYTLTTPDGNGALGGTTAGTIDNGDSSDTLTGITYDTVEAIHLKASGDLAASPNSDAIDVLPPDGSGSMGVSPSHVLHGSSGNTLTFSFSPASATDNIVVRLVVPSDWSAPSTNPAAPGYTTVGCESCNHAGDVSVVGHTITVSSISSNQTIFIVYGDQGSGGPGATAPSTVGSEQWDASSQSTSDSGSLQPLGSSPSVEVMSPAADGSGTLAVEPTTLTAGSTGNDLTFTYTAPSGGLLNGAITIAKPAGGWTAFSGSSTQVSGCPGCSASYPSGNLELDGVTLDAGDQATIDLTTDAPQSVGSYPFAAQEKSQAGGTLTDLASSPSVTVGPASPAGIKLGVTSTTQAVGASQNLTLTAVDAYGNTATSFDGTKTIDFSGFDDAPDGTHPTVTDDTGSAVVANTTSATIDFSNGVADQSGSAPHQLSMTLYQGGTEHLSAREDSGLPSSNTADVGVTPLALDHFLIQKNGGGVIGVKTAGTPFTIQIWAEDAHDNVLSSGPNDYTGTVDVDSTRTCSDGCTTTPSFTHGILTDYSVTLTQAGGATITATDHGGTATGTSNGFDVNPAALSHFKVEKDGGGAIGDQAAGVSFSIQVTAQDKFGNTRTDFAGTVDVGSNANCTAGCAQTGTFTGGQLTGVAVTLTKARSGAWVSVKDHGGTRAGVSNTFTVDPGSAAQLAITSGTHSVQGGGDGEKALTAEVRDAYGNFIGDDNGTSVTFHQTAGPGRVSGLGARTAQNGVATDNVAGHRAGSITIQASADGLSSDSTTFSVTHGSLNKVVFTSPSTNLRSGSTRSLTVKLEDASGNLIDTGPASTATVSFSKQCGCGTISPLHAIVAAVGGIASEQITGVRAGEINLLASAGGASATQSFEVVPGPLHQLAFVNSDADVRSGSSRSLTVALEDANGNLIDSGPTSGATVHLVKQSGTGTLDSLPVDVSASGGVATTDVTGLRTGAITVKAGVGAVSGSQALTVVPGPLDHLVFNTSLAPLHSGSTRTLKVKLVDGNGNVIDSGPTSSADVHFSKLGGSGVGTVTPLPDTVAASGGIATLDVTGARAGSMTIKAAAGGDLATVGLTVVPGAPHQLVFTSSTAGLALGDHRVLTVVVEDAAGNIVGASSPFVTFAKLSGAGVVSGLPATVQVAAGVVKTTVIATGVGPIHIQATSGLLVAGTTAFSISP